MPDQSTGDELHEVLSSQLYADAFEQLGHGTDPALLPDEQRDIVRRAKELSGTNGPGYPMPVFADPTRGGPRG